MNDKAIVGGVYRDKTFKSMLPKKVIGVHEGIVTLDRKRYLSNENVTFPEQQFLRENWLDTEKGDG